MTKKKKSSVCTSISRTARDPKLTVRINQLRGCVLFQKLMDPQRVTKFSAFNATSRLIAVLTTSRHLSPSQARLIQSTLLHPNLILHSHQRLGLPICFFPQISITKHCMRLFSPPVRATFPAHLILLH